MVSIGDELPDAYKSTTAWFGNGNKWLNDLQEFYRERAAIERESAAKLGQLAAKHFSKKASVSATISVGPTPTATPGSLENASATAWMEVLTQTEEISKERKRLADELTVQVADQLSGLQTRFEGLREYFSTFHSTLESDRDACYGRIKKAKLAYDDACESMEHARAKGKKVETKEQDMVNAKDAYLLAINVGNRMKDKYYHDDLPELLDTMQNANEARTSQLNSVLKLAIALEKEEMDRCKGHLDEAYAVIEQNRPELDVEMFVKHNLQSNWAAPTDFYFQPCALWHDDEQMTTDENGLRFLRARLAKASSENDAFTLDAQKAHHDFEKARDAADVDFQEVTATQALPLLKQHASALQALIRAETKRIAGEVEIETIEASTAGLDMSSVPLTRTKTTRTVFGKKKEIVEVIEPDSKAGRHRSLGVKSLLARSARASGISSGPTAKMLYDFASGGPSELSVKAGEKLQLVARDDGTGWVKVRRGDETGLVPASYADIPIPTTPAPRSKDQMVALYDYEAGDDGQLTIRANDTIHVLKGDPGNGWTSGELNGQRGIFPTSYAKYI